MTIITYHPPVLNFVLFILSTPYRKTVKPYWRPRAYYFISHKTIVTLLECSTYTTLQLSLAAVHKHTHTHTHTHKITSQETKPWANSPPNLSSSGTKQRERERETERDRHTNTQTHSTMHTYMDIKVVCGGRGRQLCVYVMVVLGRS